MQIVIVICKCNANLRIRQVQRLKSLVQTKLLTFVSSCTSFSNIKSVLIRGGGDFRRGLFFRIFRDFLFGGIAPTITFFVYLPSDSLRAMEIEPGIHTF